MNLPEMARELLRVLWAECEAKMKAMMHIKVSAIAGVFAAGLAASAQAAVLYYNIPGFPDSTPPVNGYASPDANGENQVYQAFTLGAASSITHTDFAVTDTNFLGNGIHPAIEISIWNSTLLGPPVFIQTFDSNLETISQDLISGDKNGYDILGVDLPGWSLTAGNYYISYFAPPDPQDPQDPQNQGLAIPAWDSGTLPLVQTNGTQDANPIRDLDGNPGINAPDEFGAFDLIGTSDSVPEPASLALFGMALAGLGLLRRRKA